MRHIEQSTTWTMSGLVETSHMTKGLTTRTTHNCSNNA